VPFVIYDSAKWHGLQAVSYQLLALSFQLLAASFRPGTLSLAKG
jgi:hypothetical protein